MFVFAGDDVRVVTYPVKAGGTGKSAWINGQLQQSLF